ncbi:STAS domain-containing protein [Modestobacter roseus]|uniref:STAS domain-containing protein n=1 Tax=Modestobacter roseus TaxID=1181884 RepID=A0A562IQL8_9ACTN|nr:STAS domain-containing protein [Modestobacter roseus]MQA34634.1 STAS domain-containing protein [Modestobacter roseus]TWH73106.1 STAS domain-containing protein [Modestobacter roseus]
MTRSAHQPETAYQQFVDARAGAIRAGGRLSVQGADLMRGAVLVLQGHGHRRVVLDLEGVQAVDDDGLHALRSLQDAMSATGRELVLLHPPAGVGAR